jgi:acetolactate synthase-1/2/3 large subunit
LGGRYADVAHALGGHAERVDRPDELRAALERCIASVAAGQAALCEVATHEEPAMAGHT